jgi:hypothetical protein
MVLVRGMVVVVVITATVVITIITPLGWRRASASGTTSR